MVFDLINAPTSFNCLYSVYQMNPDKVLLARLKKADEDVFKEIFDFYFPKVHRFVYSYIKDPSDDQLASNVWLTFNSKLRNTVIY